MSNINKIKTIFAGTPEFSIPSLKALINDNFFEVVAVITQGDKKVGRKQILTSPAVKIEAIKNKIPVLQPVKIENDLERIKKLKPDIMVFVSYGQIIKQNLLDIPRLGCFNLHGSILPKYRGAAVIQAPIINGDKFSGATIIKMDEGLDTGPIIKQNKIILEPNETSESLYNKISIQGADLLVNALKGYIEGKIKPKNQDDSETTYIPKLKKEDGKIDWSKDALKIERETRALNPFPGAYTKLEDKNLKIKKVSSNILNINKFPFGKIFLYKNNLVIQCGKNALIIEKLQLEGKKEMETKDFLQGHRDIEGKILE
ncbi:methionyl-tRNA formyltransferase [bacterium]|nr:methionyl-tRNA formyltransferase [bacterium]